MSPNLFLHNIYKHISNLNLHIGHLCVCYKLCIDILLTSTSNVPFICVFLQNQIQEIIFLLSLFFPSQFILPKFLTFPFFIQVIISRFESLFTYCWLVRVSVVIERGAHSSGGSRIPQRRGRQPPRWGANVWFGQKIPKNCMKMKEFGPRGGGASLAPP